MPTRFSSILERARLAPETLTNEDRAIVGPHALAEITGERCTCRLCNPEPYRLAARRLARVQPRELDDPCDVM